MSEVSSDAMVQINSHLETIAKTQAAMAKSQNDLAVSQTNMSERLLTLEVGLKADKEMRHERNNNIADNLAKHDERMGKQDAKIQGVQRLVWMGLGAVTAISLFAQTVWAKITGGGTPT